MEKRFVKIPFDVELAKEITNGSKEGRVVTRDGRQTRIICWDMRNESFPLAALACNNDNSEDLISYTMQGRYCRGTIKEAELDLMLEVPEETIIKDGDVVAFGSDENRPAIGIFKQFNGEKAHSDYVCLTHEKYLTFDWNNWMSDNLRLATEEERQKLIDALKKDTDKRAKQCLKMLGVDVEQECDLTPGQPVIGVDGRGEWRFDFFSHYKAKYRNGNYVCSSRSYTKCLPYNEQTAHLLGTTDNPQRTTQMKGRNNDERRGGGVTQANEGE